MIVSFIGAFYGRSLFYWLLIYVGDCTAPRPLQSKATVPLEKKTRWGYFLEMYNCTWFHWCWGEFWLLRKFYQTAIWSLLAPVTSWLNYLIFQRFISSRLGLAIPIRRLLLMFLLIIRNVFALTQSQWQLRSLRQLDKRIFKVWKQVGFFGRMKFKGSCSCLGDYFGKKTHPQVHCTFCNVLPKMVVWTM